MAVACSGQSDYTVFAESLNKQVKLVLNGDKLTLHEDTETEVISFNLKEVIGMRVTAPGSNPRQRRRSFRKSRRSNSTSSDATYCVGELCTYSLDQTLAKPAKKLKFHPFLFNSADTFEGNKELATQCRQAIQMQCLKDARGNSNEATDPIKVPQLLTVINPFSGKKKGVKEYQETVQPLLEVAGVIVEEVLITEQQNHAKEFIQSFDFSRITGIICVGGDGTLYEILNGIMCRDDSNSVMNSISFGMIPTGSGNAILSSLLHEQGEEYSMLNAINQIIRGCTQVMSTALVTMATQTSYMTNAVTWGLIADVDIESEVLRFMGGDLRYTIGALKCILQKRTYRGRLSYLPVEERIEQSQPLEEGTEGTPEQSKDTQDQQQSIEDTENHTQDDLPHTEIQDPSNNSIPDPSSPIPKPNNPIPGLHEPIPSNWITIEDDFVSVHVTIVSKLSRTMVGHPSANLGCDQLFIVCIPGSTTRGRLFNALQASESGDYVNHAGVYTYIARACRIEPLSDSGRLVVDGEPIEYGPLQIQISDTKMNVYSRKNVNC